MVWDRAPTLPNTRCSACSRMAQVFTSTRSAPSSVVGEGIAHPGQVAPEALGVGLVLLAAVGVHEGQLLAGGLVQQGMDLVTQGQLAGDLRRGNGRGLSHNGFLPWKKIKNSIEIQSIDYHNWG